MGAAITTAIETASGYAEEYRIRRPDGTVRWVAARGVCRRDDPRGAVLFPGALIDVTERKRTEEALRESRERFRTSFDDAPIGIALVALDGRFLDVNRALSGIVGYTKEELLARTFQEPSA